MSTSNQEISGVTIVWMDSSGGAISPGGAISIDAEISLQTRSTLSFTPLQTSHGGVYTCRATISSPFGTIQETDEDVTTVTVKSRFLTAVTFRY